MPIWRQLSFQTKVLIPTVVVMALLVGITIFVVNRRFTSQFSAQADQNLNTAGAIFLHGERIRLRNEVLQYRNLANEPRYKQQARRAMDSEDQAIKNTWRSSLRELLSEIDRDFVLFTTPRTNLLASHTKEGLAPVDLQSPTMATSVRRALQGEANADTIRIGNRLFDVVSVPIEVGGEQSGVLTFGHELGEAEAQELKELTHSEIVFIADKQVAASSIADTSLYPRFVQLYEELSRKEKQAGSTAEAKVNGEHFLCRTGRFASQLEDPAVGYLIFSSIEKASRELAETQTLLFVGGLLAMTVGVIATWFILVRLTRPLRSLRAGAEAVGRGDFTFGVKVQSSDECGQLAAAFNQMTENIRKSHAELQQTVETLKTTQAQLVQREKLSAIGEFVSGVTHELNNPLSAVIGFSELLKTTTTDVSHRKYLDNIVSGAFRCRKIVQNLLSFARQHPPERHPVNLNELVEATLDFMQYEFMTSNILVERSLDPKIPTVVADPHQVQQVFLNIVNNARQAMEANQGGVLKVSSERLKEFVRIRFTDNGPGISPENLSRIFNPFFTTKEVGKGTGLGLSVSYGIIQEHHGLIQVESKVGVHTTFTIDLPYEAQAEVSLAKPAVEQPEKEEKEGKARRVLVIDDEESLLAMIRAALNIRGYEVDTAQDGEAALTQMTVKSYDVILCDFKMPGLNGRKVFERLQELSPSAARRVIFMTGDIVSENTQEFLDRHHLQCLAKPFTLVELREAVRKVGDAEPVPGM